MHTKNHRQKGFTLVEIAVVMVILGLLLTGGMKLAGVLTKQKVTAENRQYMELVKTSLLAYAHAHGKLPFADTDNDGNADEPAVDGFLPYKTLGVKPNDIHGRQLKYHIHAGMGDRKEVCATLKNDTLSGVPFIWVDGSVKSVAAVIISGGLMDRDGDGLLYDSAQGGNNNSGNPHYVSLRAATDTFDDMAIYTGRWELYAEICKPVPLTVINNLSLPGNTVYIRDTSSRIDRGSAAATAQVTFYLPAGTTVELRDEHGDITHSTPTTPLSLIAGQSTVLTVP